jgi:hypothetical protein
MRGRRSREERKAMNEDKTSASPYGPVNPLRFSIQQYNQQLCMSNLRTALLRHSVFEVHWLNYF